MNAPPPTPFAARPPSALVVQPPVWLPEEFIDYPPLLPHATACTAAALAAAGCRTRAIDAGCLTGARFERENGGWRWGVDEAAFLAALTEEEARSPDILVLSQSIFQRTGRNAAFLARLIGLARSWPGSPAVVVADQAIGGMHTNDLPDAERLAALPPIDALARYESDAAMAEIVAALRAGAPLPKVVRGFAPDLDRLPDPAWDLLDLAAYQRALESAAAARTFSFQARPGTLPLLATRGCPFRCRFCFPEAAWEAGARVGAFRRLNAARAARLVESLAARGARHLVFLDATLNGAAEPFHAILAALERLDLTADVPNGLRADLLPDDDVARLARLTPLLSISAESGDQDVVDRLVDKRLDLAHVERVARAADAAGLPLLAHFMIGLPGETMESVNRTLDAAWELFFQHGARPSVQFATPFPGTPLHREAMEKRLLAADAPPAQDLPALTTVRPTLDAPGLCRATLARMRERLLARVQMASHQKLIVNLTYNCNSHCSFCATADRARKDGDFEEQALALVDARRRGFRLLDIDGGEPTLAPHLVRFIRRARELGYEQVVVTTNGRLLSHRPNAERLMRSGLTGVLVSLHGPTPLVHETVTQTPGSFAETLGGLRHVLALARRDMLVGVNTTISTENLASLSALGALVADMGVPRWNLQVVTPFGRARTGRLVPPMEETAAGIARALGEFHQRMTIRVINMPFCFLPGWEGHLVEDVGKSARTMHFIGADPEVLFYYLGSRRRSLDACPACEWRVMCGGVQHFEHAPQHAPAALARAPA